ncbi:MAG: hypothetical protein RID07_06070, partial [Lacipirellulaceae bacterium]
MLQHLKTLIAGPLSGAATQKKIEQLSRQVAEQSVDFVCQLIANSTRGMTLCETRGYIRARAGAEIRKQTRLLLASEAASVTEHRSMIVEAATNRIVPQVLRQLVRANVAVPAAEPQA